MVHPELIEWGWLLDGITQDLLEEWCFMDDLLNETGRLMKKSRKVLLCLMDRSWDDGLYSTFSWLSNEEIELYFCHWTCGNYSFFACYRADIKGRPNTHVYIDNNRSSVNTFLPSAAAYLWIASGGVWVRMTCGPTNLDTIVGTLKASELFAPGKLFIGGSGKYAKAAVQVAIDRPSDVGGLIIQDMIWDDKFHPDMVKEIPTLLLYSPRCYESIYKYFHQMRIKYFGVAPKNVRLTDNSIATKFLFAFAGVWDFSFADKECVF